MHKPKMPVLSVCEIPNYVNVEQLKKFVTDYLAPRISFYQETKKKMVVESAFSEYFIAKSTEGVEIGGGHCPMDVRTFTGDGIDAMCLCFNGSQTNEKSVIQNFSVSGKALDGLFAEKKDVEALALYKTDLKKKWSDVKRDKDLADLYYACFTSTDTSVYLTFLKIDPEQIDAVESGGFRGASKESKNILVKNFIDPAIGIVTLYKSKKRIELRLKDDMVNSEHTVELYKLP